MDQYAYQFAPARPEDAAEPAVPSEPAPPTRIDVESAAREVATMLGAASCEAISCLPAHLADARAWLPASGPDDARIWLVIIRGSVAIPRPGGGMARARSIEVAIDAANGRALGFRVPN